MSAIVHLDHTQVMLAHRRREREALAAAKQVELPPVILPATVTSPDEPWVPRAVRTAFKQAYEAGHKVRLTRAIGPWLDAHGNVAHDQERTLCLAVQGASGQRAVLHWRWRGDKWVAEDGHNYRTGQIMSITAARDWMKTWGQM